MHPTRREMIRLGLGTSALLACGRAVPLFLAQSANALADDRTAPLKGRILVVVQLELASLRNSARLLSMFQQIEGMSDRVKVVLNRAGAVDVEISVKKAEETLKMPISWQIPNAAKVFQTARIRGLPISDVAKGSRPHQVFLEMAKALRPASEAVPAKERKSLFAAFF